MLLLTWGLIASTLISVDHGWLPEEFVQAGLWLGLVANQWALFARPDDALLGALSGGGAFWCIAALIRMVFDKAVADRSDYLLLALFGAWGGWQILPVVSVLAVLFVASGWATARCIRGAGAGAAWLVRPGIVCAGWLVLMAGGLDYRFG